MTASFSLRFFPGPSSFFCSLKYTLVLGPELSFFILYSLPGLSSYWFECGYTPVVSKLNLALSRTSNMPCHFIQMPHRGLNLANLEIMANLSPKSTALFLAVPISDDSTSVHPQSSQKSGSQPFLYLLLHPQSNPVSIAMGIVFKINLEAIHFPPPLLAPFTQFHAVSPPGIQQ